MAASCTELKRIETSGGEVLRALRSDDEGFLGVEEAYFSRVDPGSIRGWKQHTEMTVNVVVPAGHVRFVVAGDEGFDVFDLGPDHSYGRLSIDPGSWFAFQGGSDGGLVLNLANILHRPDEANAKDLGEFGFSW